MPLTTWTKRAMVIIATAILAACAVLSARTGLADHWSDAAEQQLDTPGVSANMEAAQIDLHRAVHDRPGIATYWNQLATVESLANPQAAERDVRHALQLDAQSSDNWYELGLIELQLGDSNAAMAALRQAVQHDPAGAKAHFEFANLARALGQQQLFRQQLQAAAAVMGSTYVWPVLTAASSDGYSPQEMAALLAHASPLDRAFGIYYFTGRREWKVASSILMETGPCVGTFPAQMCHGAAIQVLRDLTIQAKTGKAGKRAEAVSRAQKAWDHARAVGIIQQGSVKLGQIQDPGFQHTWLGTLFSWRDTRVLPVVVEPTAGPNGSNATRFDFSAVDRQQGSLLEQDLLVVPGRRYLITLSSRDQSSPQEGGVTAAVVAPPGTTLGSVTLPLSSQWSPSQLSFTAPADTPVVTLQIQYNRPNGETLLQSSVEIAAPKMAPEESQR